MKNDITIVTEDGYRSKNVNLNQACDMVRVTLEMPIGTWRNIKPDVFDFEVSHSRRQFDFKKEETVVCPECNALYVNIFIKEIDDKESGCKLLAYKCGGCKKEFSTLLMDAENQNRLDAFKVRKEKIKNS